MRSDRRRFGTFEESWRHFLNRRDPLESFFDGLPENESYVLAWLLPFEKRLTKPVEDAQRALSHVGWVVPQAVHFLHTSLAGLAVMPRRPTQDEVDAALDAARGAWNASSSFEVTYRQVNCFHEAVVIEVVGDGPQHLVEKLAEADLASAFGSDVSPLAVKPSATFPT